MRKLKTLFALLVLSFFTIGNVWATDVTFSKGDFSASGDVVSASKSGVTVSCTKGNIPSSASNKYVTFTEGNTLTISTTVGNITAIDFTCTSTDYTGNLSDVSGISTTSWSISVDNPGSKTTVRVSGIVVTISESSTPAVAAKPTSLDFGTVKQHASVAAKTFKFKGANLTAGVTLEAPTGYSISETSFTAEQAMASDSVEITVTPSTETAGTFNGNLTIASAAATPEFTTVNVALSMEVTPTYAVAVAVNDGEMGSATINGEASVYGDENDTELALVATANPGYEFVNWEVTDGDENDIEITSATSASTTAGLVTGPVTITANFQAQSCTSLAAPTLDEVAKTYNSATIAWNAVTNAEGYLLNIKKHSDASAVLTDSIIVAPAVSCEITGLDAETQYDFTVMALGDGKTYCDENNPLLEDNFTTEALPSATLTLSENGETRTWGSDLKVASVIALPTAVAAGQEVVGKVLVGYTNEANKTYSHDTDAPTVLYAPGANYTIADTEDKLYAVYAIETPGTPSTWELDQSDFGKVTESGSGYAPYNGSHSYSGISYTTSQVMNQSDKIQFQKNAGVMYNTTAFANNIQSLAIDGISSNVSVYEGASALTETQSSGALTLSDGKYTFSSGKKFFRIQMGNATGTAESITVTIAGASTYSKYTTSGAKAPQATPASTSVAIEAAAVADGSIAVEYANVALANVKVATFENEACTDTLDAGWLVASLTNETKQIAYTAAANASYANTRSAYIQLVAPSPADGVAADTVVVTVTQAANPNRVFASLEALAASDVPAGDSVTVTLTKEVINSLYYWNSNLSGLNLATTKDDKNIRIYYTTNVSAISEWEANGSVSGVIRAQWTTYNSVWQLKPASTWSWTDLEYKDPTATGVDNTDASVKAVKVLREGQIFILRGEKVYTVQGQLVK